MARNLPRTVRAARAFDEGTSIHIIADEFGWTVHTAWTNVARGRRWKDFCRKNNEANRLRRRRAFIRRKLTEIPAAYRAIVEEARRLGIAVPEAAL